MVAAASVFRRSNMDTAAPASLLILFRWQSVYCSTQQRIESTTHNTQTDYALCTVQDLVRCTVASCFCASTNKTRRDDDDDVACNRFVISLSRWHAKSRASPPHNHPNKIKPMLLSLTNNLREHCRTVEGNGEPWRSFNASTQ